MPTVDMTRQLDKEQALGILMHLNAKELQDLLDDDSKLDELVADNQQVKALDAEKQTVVASNKSLSEFNLSREPRLSQGKEQLVATHQNLEDLYKSVSEKKARVESAGLSTSPEEASALLKTAAESTELESDLLSEQFLNSELNVDTFLDSYIEKRTLAHVRKIKAEKLSEMLRNKTPGLPAMAGHGAPLPGGPPAASPASWFGSAQGPQYGAPYGAPYRSPSYPSPGYPSPYNPMMPRPYMR